MDIRVPEIGESVTEGTIAKWIKREGDQVEEWDVLVEIETDKVNVEVNAEQAGVITDIHKQEGETVQVGEVIATLGEARSEQQGNGHAEEEQSKHGKDPADQQELTPANEPVEAESARSADHSEKAHKQQIDEQTVAMDSKVSPAARRLARKRGINVQQLQGHDPMGRVGANDVQTYTDQSQQQSVQHSPERAFAKDESSPLKSDRPMQRKRMSRRRQTIAKRLVEAQQSSAMLTTFNEVDMSAIMDIRRRRKEAFREEHDVNLGFMSFFTKAVIGALKVFPLLNAEIVGNEMLVKQFYDIGIAVSAEEGLVVPVIRDADRLSFAQIEQQVKSVAEKVRENKLTLQDLQGGTFTITNGGIFGSLLSTPILNTPQVGILGMHKIQKRPVTLEDDSIESRPMMYIALSYDHRIVDGSEAVRFLVKIKDLLEDPETLLLEG